LQRTILVRAMIACCVVFCYHASVNKALKMKKTDSQPTLSEALRANLKRRKGQKQATRLLKSSPSIRTSPAATDRQKSA
jgi:hypothetical protein